MPPKSAPLEDEQLKPKVNANLVAGVNIACLVAFLFYFGVLVIKVCFTPETYGILILAIACLNTGAFFGFLYSSFGKERENFSSVFTAINAAIGGASIADISNENGVIRTVLEKIGESCQVHEAFGASIIIAFFFTGFFALYFNRKFILNPESYFLDLLMPENQARLLLSTSAMTNDDPESGPKLPSNDNLLKAATSVASRPEAGQEGGPGKLLQDGKAFLALNKLEEAENALTKSLSQKADNPEALTLLGQINIFKNCFLKASDLLEKAVQFSGTVPVGAWKLLGYCLLFYPADRPEYPQKLRRSISATRTYLQQDPDDIGAQLNLACAYGQIGPEDLETRNLTLNLVKEIISRKPSYRDKFRDLAQPGGDFEKWKDLTEFIDLIQ